MNKIFIFYGSREEYSQKIPQSYYPLETLVQISDSANKIVRMKVPEDFTEVVAYTMSYSSITQGGIQNFNNILDCARDILEDLYLQNPPDCIREELLRIYGEEIVEIEYQKYSEIDIETIRKCNERFGEKIIGQESVKSKLLTILYEVYSNKNQKLPQVAMFYGPSGVGKTETAKFLSELLGGKLFRMQMSMYQTNDYFGYLYGTEHNNGSFCKDLLERKTNIILLDEFDKAHPSIWKAFYQMFDEGIYKDTNYTVSLDNTIIICTSNEPGPEEIRRIVGDPLYYRFDHVVRFDALSDEIKKQITQLLIEEIYNSLSDDEKKIVDKNEMYTKYMPLSTRFNNFRNARTLIKNDVVEDIVKKLLEE